MEEAEGRIKQARKLNDNFSFSFIPAVAKFLSKQELFCKALKVTETNVSVIVKTSPCQLRDSDRTRKKKEKNQTYKFHFAIFVKAWVRSRPDLRLAIPKTTLTFHQHGSTKRGVNECHCKEMQGLPIQIV